MATKLIRMHITLNEKLSIYFKKFKHDSGYSTDSQMFRDSVIKNAKQFYSKSSGEIKILQNTINCLQDIFVKKTDILNERIELLNIRIKKEGITSQVGDAMKDISNLLLHREHDYSEILMKCKKYDDRTLNTAISLLIDSDRIGTKYKN